MQHLSLEDLLTIRVSSASQQDESLREAPVPVTVITSDMIRMSGVRNLREALNLFVPGFTFGEDYNEYITPYRGVYATTNSKMLILVDGHRDNARFHGDSNPDFGLSISPDKVKQIEVMRGPGSVLYGNVALMAVINIVTKEASKIDGAVVTAGVGNHGQILGEVTFGKSFSNDYALVLWAHYYQAAGQKVDIPGKSYSLDPAGGSAYIDRFANPGSYDTGLKLNFFRDLQLLAIRRTTHYSEPYTAVASNGYAGQLYAREQFRTWEGNEPGQTMTYNHLELRYSRTVLNRLYVEASAYLDSADMVITDVSNPAGTHRVFSVNERDGGFLGFGRYSYDLRGALGRGNLTLGTQIEQMWLVDAHAVEGTTYSWDTITDSNAQLLALGRERSISCFGQLKHYLWGDKVILNTGVRYDYKLRANDVSINNLSPRVALVAQPHRMFDVKLTYSKSFVDAPYWYRMNSSADYRGAIDLQPELLQSFQVTPSVHLLDGKLVETVNVYYDRLTHLIYKNPNAVAPAPLYENAGRMNNIGIEEEVMWLGGWYHARGNATWQRVLSMENYLGVANQDHVVRNVPSLVANLIVDVAPIQRYYPNLWLNLSVRYIGEQYSPLNISYKDAAGNPIPDRQWVDPENKINQVVVLNLGFRINDLLVKGIDLDGTVHNLLDTRYHQAGSPIHPYAQEGRWLMGMLRYRYR
jgi:outer membrane receptor for ferrienterochelin and colicins